MRHRTNNQVVLNVKRAKARLPALIPAPIYSHHDIYHSVMTTHRRFQAEENNKTTPLYLSLSLNELASGLIMFVFVYLMQQNGDKFAFETKNLPADMVDLIGSYRILFINVAVTYYWFKDKRTRKKLKSRPPKLSLHGGGQVKALSTVCYTVKQIADVIERSRKATMNCVRHLEEYGTKKSSGPPSKLNGREKGQFCGQRRVARQASMESVRTVTLMLQKLRCGECWTSVPILYDHG
uniref:Transmembrane protein n=1 Tax=Heterorhabditis bacteriophora TaxID=37862 RepID=A0A1I7XUI0_HETBA